MFRFLKLPLVVLVTVTTTCYADIPVIKQNRNDTMMPVSMGFEGASYTVSVSGNVNANVQNSGPATQGSVGGAFSLIDPQTEALVKQVETVYGDAGLLDHALIDVANPFNTSIFVSQIDFIQNGGSTHTRISEAVFIALQLKSGGICITEHGNAA